MSKISVLFSFTIKISVLFSFTIIAVWVFANCSESKLDVGIYELKRGDFSLKLTNWGATIVSLVLPDKHGKLADVVLGYDSIKDYMDDIIVTFLEPTKNNDPPMHLLWVPRQRNDTTYFGATVGRVANRIGGAQFTLNGTHYKLVANEGKNMLHGGSIGFSDVVWKVKNYHDEGHSPYITFSYHSFDGEEGFPGNLLVTVTYALVEQGMSVTMEGKALNKATPVNLAQHAYWNLGGHNSGDILSNEIQIFGSHITPVDKGLIPTGKIASVKGTPYDLLEPTTIASKINKLPNGYDINYVLDRGDSKRLKKAAMVHNKKSGRVMELFTNQPGMQFYTGNFIKDVKGKGGFVYQDHAGLCLETQGFPDSVNHPNFPSQIIFPGKKYNHRMLFKFSTMAT